jgi:hypothetical protein
MRAQSTIAVLLFLAGFAKPRAIESTADGPTLSRAIEARHTRPAPSFPLSDASWHDTVALEIGPCANLNLSQRPLSELYYAMWEGRVVITVRCALLYCALRLLGPDIGSAARLQQDQQIVLLKGKFCRELSV